MLQIKDVHKSFGQNEVLKGVSLTVNKGDLIAIIGPSGSGKTTLLKSINFLQPADKGEMDFDGIKISMNKASKKTIAQIRKKTAFVFQNYNLFNNKTALENVMEGLLARKIDKKEAEVIARKMLEKVELSDKCNSYPANLSGGQQQRVGIARALAVNPDVILLDEPTSALDPELIGEILALLKKISSEGTTMIMTTHQMSFAKQAATHVVFLDSGVIVEEGKPEQIFNSPKQERTKEFLKRILPQSSSNL